MLRRMIQEDSAVGIDLTPIIDMVFLLLIFFLVATTFHQSEREMKVVLPESRASGPISLTLRELVVNVMGDGSLIVSGEGLSEPELDAMVRDRLSANPEQKVAVRADRTVSYGVVARVLDICKHAGVREPYLDTVPMGPVGP